MSGLTRAHRLVEGDLVVTRSTLRIEKEENADERVSITAGSVQLEGSLMVPSETEGVVLFAHSGGSSLYSTQTAIPMLRQVGLADTLAEVASQSANG